MKVVAVGDVSEQVRGVSYSKSESSEEPRPGYVAVLRANNITDEGLTFDDLVYVPVARVSDKQRIHANDVVIAASSGSLSVVGKAAQARQTVDGSFGAFCKVLRPNGAVDPLYFGHFFRTPVYRRTVSGLAAGANINNLKNEHLDNLQIPLPPLPEQKRIAAILDAADALRAKRRESIEQLDSLIQATFLEMFGDPVTNPKGWATSTVGAEVSFMTSGSRGWAKYYASEGDVFIRIQNLRSGRLDLEDVAFVTAPDTAESRRTKVEQGDVLISITADLGRTAVVPPGLGTAFINQHLVLLRFRDMNPFFIAQLFETDGGQSQFTRLNRQGVKAGLNFDDIRKLVVLKPSLGLQARFASIVESIEQQKDRLKAHLAELDTLFASLQSRAFNGELVA
jgi:type I restriction enzyme S subunit